MGKEGCAVWEGVVEDGNRRRFEEGGGSGVVF